MMTGDKVMAAEEAEQIGMIYKSVAAEEFDAYIEKLAVKMAKYAN